MFIPLLFLQERTPGFGGGEEGKRFCYRCGANGGKATELWWGNWLCKTCSNRLSKYLSRERFFQSFPILRRMIGHRPGDEEWY